MKLSWAIAAGMLVSAPIMALPTRLAADADRDTGRHELHRQNGAVAAEVAPERRK